MIVYILFLISIVIGFKMNNFWYQKSRFQPPDWLFGIIWPILYATLFVAYFSIKDTSFEYILAFAFFLQTLWLISFNQQQLAISRMMLILIVLNAFYLVQIAYKEQKWVGLLLIPYLLWVTFATVLNFTLTPKEKNTVN